MHAEEFLDQIYKFNFYHSPFKSDVTSNSATSGVNNGCRIRVRNTLKARKSGYNGIIDNQSDDESMDDDTYESNTRNRRRRTNQICPHYKQLEDYNTSLLTYSSFIPPQSANINCNDIGGERSKLGTHDIEDLVAFGENLIL